MNNKLNKFKYPGAKRLMLEAQELKDNTEDYCAQPIDDNLFEWHFTLRGPPDTAFDGGYYHGRLSFPTEYPMKPPSIILLTPNGRFETNKKICLSISGYHPETWQPSWSVRTALLALIAFMPTKANGAIGSLDFSDTERRRLALKSRTWRCETCGLIKDLLVHPNNAAAQNDNSTGQCEPGTSKVLKDLTDLDTDRQSDFNSRSNSSNESRDNFLDSKKPQTNNSDFTLSTDDQQQPDALSGGAAIHIDRQLKLDDSRQSPSHSSVQYQRDEMNQSTLQNFAERRRAYPPLILKSIFILLSLLILRRVVMVIQS